MTALDDARWRDGSAALAATDQLPGGTAGVWLALPPNALPRILVPRAELRTVAPAVGRLVSHGTLLRRASVGASTTALAYGGGNLLPTNERWSIVAGRLLRLAREVAGRPDALGVVRLSQQRPNRKPVVQLLDPDTSSTLAFVKIGWDELSAPLIRNEAATLRAIAPPPSLLVPELIGYVDGPVPALASSPLTPARHTRGPAATLDLARRSLAIFGPDGLGGDAASAAPLATTGVVAELHEQVDALPSGPLTSELRLWSEQVLERDGAIEAQVGRWHGDWVHANANTHGDMVVAWDWERSHVSAPFGLDAAYLLLSRQRPVDALVPLVELLGSDVTPRLAAALLRLAALTSATRHTTAAIAGITTRRDEAMAALEATLAL